MPLEIDLSRYPVLIVDDEQDNLDIIRFNYRKVHPLLFAQGGPAALEVLKKDDVACIVSDQRMPEMNGSQLADKIQSICPTVKTLFMSGYTSDIIASHGVVEDGVNFIQKPFSGQQLIRSVQKSLDMEW